MFLLNTGDSWENGLGKNIFLRIAKAIFDVDNIFSWKQIKYKWRKSRIC